MAQYHSGSSLSQHPLKELFLPAKPVFILYALISLIMLALLNISSLWQLLVSEPVTAQDVAPLTDELSAFQDRLSTPIVMVFWLFIGAITYTAIWLSENVFFIAKTEVAQSHYVSRSPTEPRRYWESAIASNVFLILILLLWISFIAVYLRLLLPTLSDLFHGSLFGAPPSERVINFMAAVMGNTVAIYLILLMRRVITYAWRATRPA